MKKEPIVEWYAIKRTRLGIRSEFIETKYVTYARRMVENTGGWGSIVGGSAGYLAERDKAKLIDLIYYLINQEEGLEIDYENIIEVDPE